jgi:hypothetical protein
MDRRGLNPELWGFDRLSKAPTTKFKEEMRGLSAELRDPTADREF